MVLMNDYIHPLSKQDNPTNIGHIVSKHLPVIPWFIPSGFYDSQRVQVGEFLYVIRLPSAKIGKIRLRKKEYGHISWVHGQLKTV
jgi:hypothetical protein